MDLAIELDSRVKKIKHDLRFGFKPTDLWVFIILAIVKKAKCTKVIHL